MLYIRRTTDTFETVNGHLRIALFTVKIPQNGNEGAALNDSKLQ